MQSNNKGKQLDQEWSQFVLPTPTQRSFFERNNSPLQHRGSSVLPPGTLASGEGVGRSEDTVHFHGEI